MEPVPSFLELLQPFRAAMTSPTFASLLTVLAGWVLCRRRTVSGALSCGLAAGARMTKHHSAYHRVFSAAHRPPDAVGLGVMAAVPGCAYATGAAVFLVVDDTLCRRRGRRMFGAGMHYDAAPTRRNWSNANQGLKRRGHCWVVLGVVVCPLWRPGSAAACGCYTEPARRHRRPYRTKVELALGVLGLVCRTLADSAYGGQNLLSHLPANCQLTCRWINNAALYAPPPLLPGGRGRRRVRGGPVPGPMQMLQGQPRRLRHAPRLPSGRLPGLLHGLARQAAAGGGGRP